MNQESLLSDKLRYYLRWTFTLLVIFIIAYVLFKNITTIVLFIFSFLLAYLLDPFVSWLTAKGLSRNLSVAILILIFLIILAIIIFILIPQIIYETEYLFQHSFFTENQEAESKVKDEKSSKIQRDKIELILEEYINPWMVSLGLKKLTREQIQDQFESIFQWIQTNAPNWISPIWNTIHTMFSSLANFIIGVLHFLILPVFTFYLLRDFHTIKIGFYESIPPSWRGIVVDWSHELDRVVGGFVRGQLIIASILATAFAIALTLLGVPLGALIGVIAGLSNIVPYMSGIVGLLPALAFSFIDQPEIGRLIWIIIIFSCAQAAEGFYLSPRIIGYEIGLHPIIVMLAIVVSGSLFGLVGIILAVPAAAIFQVALVRWHKAWRKQWI